MMIKKDLDYERAFQDMKQSFDVLLTITTKQ